MPVSRDHDLLAGLDTIDKPREVRLRLMHVDWLGHLGGGLHDGLVHLSPDALASQLPQAQDYRPPLNRRSGRAPRRAAQEACRNWSLCNGYRADILRYMSKVLI